MPACIPTLFLSVARIVDHSIALERVNSTCAAALSTGRILYNDSVDAFLRGAVIYNHVP